MKYFLLLSVFILSACSSTDRPPLRQGFACDHGFSFQTEFARDGSEVKIITQEGTTLVLPNQAAAEGQLFSNGMTSLIVTDDGNMHVEQDGKVLMRDCAE